MSTEGIVLAMMVRERVSVCVCVCVCHACAEGIVVAVPIFYATGSRWRAVMWALLTGLAEPLGALIGLAVVYGGGMTETAMGVIMGVVSDVTLVFTQSCTHLYMHTSE